MRARRISPVAGSTAPPVPATALTGGRGRTVELAVVDVAAWIAIAVAAVALAFVIGWIAGARHQHHQDSWNLRDAEAACSRNTAYIGYGWEDDQQLTTQCIADYVSMVTHG